MTLSKITPLKDYKPRQAQFNIYLKWVINYVIRNSGVLYEPNLYSALQQALGSCTEENGSSYAPSFPQTRRVLCSGILYSFACLSIFQDASFDVKEWPSSDSSDSEWSEEDFLASHEQVLKCIRSHGYELLESRGDLITADDLASDTPFKDEIHSMLLGTFASIYTDSTVGLSTVVQHIRETDGFMGRDKKSQPLPFDIEDSFLMWINNVVDLVGSRLAPTAEIPHIDDLLKDISDGKQLICVMMYYKSDFIDESEGYFGIHSVGSSGQSKLSSGISETALMNSCKNISLFEKSCKAIDVYFPFCAEDIVYANSYIKPIVMAFLAELFVTLTNVPPKSISDEEDRKSESAGKSFGKKLNKSSSVNSGGTKLTHRRSGNDIETPKVHFETNLGKSSTQFVSEPSLSKTDISHAHRKQSSSSSTESSRNKQADLNRLRKSLHSLMATSETSLLHEKECCKEEMMRIKAEGYQLYLRDMYKKQKDKESDGGSSNASLTLESDEGDKEYFVEENGNRILSGKPNDAVEGTGSKISLKLSETKPKMDASTTSQSPGGIKFFVSGSNNANNDDIEDCSAIRNNSSNNSKYNGEVVPSEIMGKHKDKRKEDMKKKKELNEKREAERRKALEVRKQLKEQELKTNSKPKRKPKKERIPLNDGSPHHREQEDESCTPKRPQLPKFYSTPSSNPYHLKINSKSNKLLIENSIKYVCLPGPVNKAPREAALRALEATDAASSPKHYLILLRDHESSKFKSLYTYNPDLDQILKVYGVGPNELTPKMISNYYKYNSGGKRLQDMPSRSLSSQIDAITIAEPYWTNRKVTKRTGGGGS